jgi:hypothetical protein
METLQNFFLFAAGVDRTILAQCPTDRNKYMGIGATIFFTGLLAFFSSGYALYTVFDNYFFALIFGLVWGLMIFNLDRYIVMSMKSNGKWWRDLGVALPRIALAVLLALVISKPLEMKIFEKEIKGELVVMEQEVFKQQEDKLKARYLTQIDDYKQQIETLKGELRDKTAVRDTLARMAQQEADGTGGSRVRNLGPIYLSKKADADKAAAELQQLSALHLPAIAEKEKSVQALEQTIQTEIAALERDRYDGLAARMEALSRLSAGSRAILLASLFLTLLFIAIETAPILVKLISYRSPYDYVLHETEHVFAMENLHKVTTRENKVRNQLKFDTETTVYTVNASIEMEKALIDQKLKEKLAELKDKSFNWKFGAAGG